MNNQFIDTATIAQDAPRDLAFGGAIVRPTVFCRFDTDVELITIYVKRISQCSPESRGFSPGTRLFSHRQVAYKCMTFH